MARKNRIEYLTKRRLISAARAGFKNASDETIEVMGYTVIAQRGWIVKKFKDGRIEKISRLPIAKRSKQNHIALD